MPARKSVQPEKEEAIAPPAPIEPQPVEPPPPAFTPGSVSPVPDKPGMVQAIAVMTLINGILNILWGLGITGSVVVSTWGFGLLCSPVTILPLVLGIFEILYAAKLLSTPPQPVQPSQTIAILEICCVLLGNLVSLVVGILALVFYSDPQVKAYFQRINGQG